MDKRAAIKSLISTASDLEKSVQSVAFDIVREAGDYELSETLLGVARDIHTISRRIQSLADSPVVPTRRKDLPPPASRKRGRPTYPRFMVTDDSIIKIGKGKSRTAKEYRHEAPRESFQTLSSWLDKTRASGKHEWPAQDVVEALTGDVPSYQTYLMLAALLASGVLAKVRGNYEAVDSDIPTAEYWEILKENFGRTNRQGVNND